MRNKMTKLQIAWEMVRKKINTKFTALELGKYIRTRHPEVDRPKTFNNSVNKTLVNAYKLKSRHLDLPDKLHITRDENVSPYEYWFYYE